TIFIYPFSRRLMYDLNSRVAGGIWWVMQYIFEKQHGAVITYSGDTIPFKESAMVIANHQSFVDFYLIHSLALRRRILSYCKYFAKDSLKYIPFFGWGMWLMGMMYIKRNWLHDRRNINNMFQRVREDQPPIWLISYLEGTRVTPEKLAESKAFAKSRCLPILNNLLLPRTKGFCECIRQLRDTHVQHLYDLTIVYTHQKDGVGISPSLVRVHTGSLGKEYSFHVYVRRFPLKDLPTEDDALTQWIYRLYQEKDEYLQRVKDQGLDMEKVRREPWF
ncbi:MAG: acyltransferase-domain-containing protein, partial [Piptocephalis tieghemiana]